MVTVLIVEDDILELKALVEKNMHEGFTVLQATNGKEGLEKALENHPDIIILDILMPHTDGLTMLKNLRTDSWGKSVPVIVFTNLDPDMDSIVKGIVEDRPVYYLAKSTEKLGDLVKKIHEVVQKPREQ